MTNKLAVSQASTPLNKMEVYRFFTRTPYPTETSQNQNLPIIKVVIVKERSLEFKGFCNAFSLFLRLKV
jgi:hypothetical protein